MNNYLTNLRANKYVGILIHNKASIYSNGITQNAYFIYECLTNIGMKCKFLCNGNDTDKPSPLQYVNIPLTKISTNQLEFDPSEFHTIITVTRSLSESEYNMFKEAKVHVVSFTCGNLLMHHMEDFVRGPNKPGVTLYVGKNAKCDELWVIPSYRDALDYIELIRGKKAFTIPHLWSNKFMKDVCENVFKQAESKLFFDIEKHNGDKVELIVLEPNLALFKNCWIPIVGCEKLNNMNEKLLDSVHVFNFPEYKSSHSMLDNLNIKPKIKVYHRNMMPEIFLNFNKRNTFPIILCWQLNNSLNYVYYEALYYGWPLVHNSPDLEGCGYYYPANDVTACANAIQYAFEHHIKNLSEYNEKSRKFLQKIHPLDEDMGKVWNSYINAGLCKHSI